MRMEKGNNRNRNEAVNRLKAACVIAVFLIHCRFPGTIGLTVRGLASFSIPAFFMISGYYSHGAESWKIRKRCFRTFHLIVGANLFYLVWDILFLAVQGESIREWLAETFQLKKFLVFLVLNESPLRGHLWFLGALLYCYLFLLVLIRQQRRKWWREGILYAVVLVLFTGNLVFGEALTAAGHNIQIPYVRNWLFCGIPSFLTGYLICGYKEKKEKSPLPLSHIRVLLFVSAAAGILEVSLIQGSELYCNSILVAGSGFLLAVYGSCGRQSRMVRFIDNNAMLLYVLQIAVIKSIQRAEQVNGLTGNKLIGWLTPIAAIFCTGLCAAVLTKGVEFWKKRITNENSDGQ